MSPAIVKLMLQLLAFLSSSIKVSKDKEEFEAILHAVEEMVEQGRNPRGDEWDSLLSRTQSLTERLEKRNKELSPDAAAATPAVARAKKPAAKKVAAKRKR